MPAEAVACTVEEDDTLCISLTEEVGEMCIDLETTADSVSKTVLDGECDDPTEYVDSDVDIAVCDSDVVDVELKLWPRTVRLAAPLADSDDETRPADSVG